MKKKELEEKKNARRKRREKVKNTTAKTQNVVTNEQGISIFADPLVEVNKLDSMIRKNREELNDVLTLCESAVEKLADRQDKLEQILFDVIVVGGVALTLLGIKAFKK